MVYDVMEEEGGGDPFCGGGPVAYGEAVREGETVTPVEAFYDPRCVCAYGVTALDCCVCTCSYMQTDQSTSTSPHHATQHHHHHHRAFELLSPDWCLDVAQQRLWGLRLHLPAIAESHTAVRACMHPCMHAQTAPTISQPMKPTTVINRSPPPPDILSHIFFRCPRFSPSSAAGASPSRPASPASPAPRTRRSVRVCGGVACWFRAIFVIQLCVLLWAGPLHASVSTHSIHKQNTTTHDDTGPTAHRVLLQQVKARLLEEIPLFPPLPPSDDELPPPPQQQQQEDTNAARASGDAGHNVLTMLRLCLAIPPPSPSSLSSSSSQPRPPSAEEKEEAALRQRRRKRATLDGLVVVTQEELLHGVGRVDTASYQCVCVCLGGGGYVVSISLSRTPTPHSPHTHIRPRIDRPTTTQVLDPLASIALLQEKDLPSPPYLAAVLLHTITALQAAAAAHAAALDQAEAAAAAAASYLGRRRQQQQQQQQQRRQRGEGEGEGEGRVDPRIVMLAVRLLLMQGRLDLLVQFLRFQQVRAGCLVVLPTDRKEGSLLWLLFFPLPLPLPYHAIPYRTNHITASSTRPKQGALDSEALALFLLREVPASAPPPPAPAAPAATTDRDSEEEAQETAREFRRLLRDMLWRLGRLDLLVLQLLRVCSIPFPPPHPFFIFVEGLVEGASLTR